MRENFSKSKIELERELSKLKSEYVDCDTNRRLLEK